MKLRPYHAYLELLVGRCDDLSYTHLPRAYNQFVDALVTLASVIDIPEGVCKTRKNSNFWKKGKIVISVKIQIFF